MLKNLIRYAGLPFIFIFPTWLYAAMSTNGNAPAWAMSSAILSIVILLSWEVYLPYRGEWRPNWKHIKLDLQFMTLIHLAFIELVGAGVAFLLVNQLGTKSPYAYLWPRHWPVWGQVVLIILTADFLRYWAHRAMHTVPLFWRVHALHHSVDRLYAFNTVRFHPIEMVLQYTILSLPFILLGVEPRVLGFWIVIHLLIAFVQHCNVDFYSHWWNKVILTPELHRWHHSVVIEESNSNYAVAFCLWDRVFGTYYCPSERKVGVLGIKEVVYPSGFLAQMKEPFMKEKK